MQCLRLTEFVRDGDCCHYARYRLDPGPAAPVHRHDFHEVFWVEAGQGLHVLNGVRRVLRAGQLVLVRANDAHAYEGPLTFSNVAFPSRRWQGLVRQYATGTGRAARGVRGTSREVQLSATDQQELELLAHALAAGNRGALATDRFLLKVLALLVATPQARPAQREAPPWIAAVLQTVGRDPRHFQSTRSLAALAGYSPEHVARALRRHTGRTPTEVINGARMAYAARRLTESGSDVLAIAMDCGFRSLGHFYRLFQRAYGMPPHSYRRHHLAIVGRGGA